MGLPLKHTITMEAKKKSLWDTILKVAIAVLSAVAGALGMNAMN